MQHSDWASRWDQGQIGFHQSDVTDMLVRHGFAVWGQDEFDRVYLPLCGKSLDLVFFAERANAVVGVEFVEQAVREFFDERALTPEVTTEPPIRYQADKYTLFAADVFSLTSADLGPVDAVFDRAALVALEQDTRRRYARHMASIVAAGVKILLVTFDYDQSHMNGPPFAVSDVEVAELFGEEFVVEHLETRDVLNEVFKARGLKAMTESAFALTRR